MPIIIMPYKAIAKKAYKTYSFSFAICFIKWEASIHIIKAPLSDRISEISDKKELLTPSLSSTPFYYILKNFLPHYKLGSYI